jgi:hypothetical protein
MAALLVWPGTHYGGSNEVHYPCNSNHSLNGSAACSFCAEQHGLQRHYLESGYQCDKRRFNEHDQEIKKNDQKEKLKVSNHGFWRQVLMNAR